MNTAHERTLALLAEVNVPVHDALEAVGPNRGGDPMLGLLYWLGDADLLDLCRAAILARKSLPCDHDYGTDDPVGLSRDLGALQATRRPQDLEKIEAGYWAHYRAKYRLRPLTHGLGAS